MLPGINTDIEYNGKIYHLQTEDNGSSNPVVVTLLFESGRILTSRKTSYADIVKSSNLRLLVRDIMSDQHRAVADDLRAGKYTGEVPIGTAARAPIPAPVPSAPRPSGERPMVQKTLDQMIRDYLAGKERHDGRG